jgi:uroporphyrinogen decarboxylase
MPGMTMTPRERLLTVLRGEVPDCVPVCPDISNMVPARMTGKPFWDIYVYKDPPLWKAHIDALKYFDLDGGFELFGPSDIFSEEEGGSNAASWEARIVLRRADGSFVTQDYSDQTGLWSRYVTVHTADNPPATNVLPAKVGLPPVPSTWEPIEGVKQWPRGMALWNLIRAEMGEQGIVGLASGATTCLINTEQEIYEYHDNPRPFYERRDEILERVERRMALIARMETKPDLLFCGASGTLVFQSPKTFRELGLPVLKRVTELAAEIGIPTHVHSCGPEKLLVKIAAEETQLTIIDPLEVAPMGDCDLAELKRLYGDRIILKGNLHTTRTMLHGTVPDVIAASQQAIDDAAAGGGFILSTGDQCGRDTPDANIRAMVETARTYGRY